MREEGGEKLKTENGEMKTSWLIGLMFVAVLAGCNRSLLRQRADLAAIDSLMQTRPDSALSLLLDEPVDDPYYQLLLSEALYKNDNPQLNRSELLEAMDYFESVDVPFLAARCHYMNGVGYYEMDSVVRACEEYLKALEIMDEHFGKRETVGDKAKFMALAHTHLCLLFSDQYLHEQAIYFGEQSLPYYDRYDAEAWHVAWILNNIGTNYHAIEQFVPALYYYDKALEVLPDTNNTTYRDIVSAKLYLMCGKGEDAEATIKQLNTLCLLSESVQELCSRYGMIGEIYYRTRKYDSALAYLDTVFCLSQNIALKKQSAEWLAEICRVQGDETGFIHYSAFLIPFTNQEENQSKIKTRLTELYNAYRQTILKQEHRQTVRNSTVRYGLTTVLFVALLLVVVALYHKSKGREKGLEKQIATERETHQMQQAALSGRLRSSNLKVQDLTKRLKQFDDGSVQQDVVTVSFEEEPICILVLERVKNGRFKAQIKCSVYESYALERRHLSELRKAADDHFNNFTIRLKKEHPRLTDMDLGYCCLLLLGLTNADISALMQREYNTVSERISKLKRIFGADCSITQFLRDFAEKPQHID